MIKIPSMGSQNYPYVIYCELVGINFIMHKLLSIFFRYTYTYKTGMKNKKDYFFLLICKQVIEGILTTPSFFPRGLWSPCHFCWGDFGHYVIFRGKGVKFEGISSVSRPHQGYCDADISLNAANTYYVANSPTAKHRNVNAIYPLPDN